MKENFLDWMRECLLHVLIYVILLILSLVLYKNVRDQNYKSAVILTISLMLVLYILHLYTKEVKYRFTANTAVESSLRDIGDHLRVLDVGGGACRLKHHLRNHSVDIIDIYKGCDCAQIYDGHHIPARDDAYDVAVASHVLHHVPHQQELLKEMARVAKNVVLIEENPSNFVQRLITKLHFHGFGQDPSMIKYIHAPREWKEIGEKAGLVLSKMSTYSGHLLNPTPGVCYTFVKPT